MLSDCTSIGLLLIPCFIIQTFPVAVLVMMARFRKMTVTSMVRNMMKELVLSGRPADFILDTTETKKRNKALLTNCSLASARACI
jgi:hypothetical protein